MDGFIRGAWDFCDEEHSMANPCQKCQSIAAWGRKLYAEGLAEGEAKLAKAEANNTADPALKPGPACGGCGLDDCRFCD